jgi:uncharacterized protein YkwD
MVNKVALGILAVIVLTAMTVGGLVGLQLGGEDPLGPNGTSTPTPTPGVGSGNASTNQTATPERTPSPEPTPSPEETVRADEFNDTRIEEQVRRLVNDRRTNRSDRTLRADSTLTEMARFHSDNLAAQGYPSHVADGYSAQERYERFGLADRCQVPDDSYTGIRTGEALETVAKSFAGRPYTAPDGETRVNENERAVARAVVDGWFDRSSDRRKLVLEEATAVGVGVTVTDDGAVYVTANLC